MRPYFRFTLPPVKIDQMDEDVWKGLREGKMNVEDAMMNLNNLRESGFQLSSRSTTLLSYLGTYI